jgi:hypothetical protein
VDEDGDVTVIDQALARLRASEPLVRAGIGAGTLHDELRTAGVAFAALGGPLEARWHQALAELAECVHPIGDGAPALNEGGVYHGAWIESTGTINAEVLDRFAPGVTRDTHLLFAAHQRDDGMIPYKVTADGPGFSQVQIVTPLARSVWRHYRRTGDRAYLETMYTATARMDDWLARYRDTRGTGGVEAFCTFDTGHDLSPRFWFVPDRGYRADARLYDPASPVLPLVAPDLTANVACQRAYLALAAEELGLDGNPWRAKAAASLEALYAQCFDDADQTFYDRDRTGGTVRVQSDVLLRVLACEVGDHEFFADTLRRYLLNTRKLLSHYGFTSLALDDPRFDHDHTHNSWGGPVNFLSLLRAPEAFEHHGHVAELALVEGPVLAAVANATEFPQCLSPWTGEAGFTRVYSPSILWLLDAVERTFGVLPRPDGELWLTGLAPTRLDHGAAAPAVAYARTVTGVRYELAGDDEHTVVHRDGAPWLAFPRGWRVVAGPDGEVRAVVGMTANPVAGELVVGGTALPLTLEPNERVDLAGTRVTARRTPGYVAPRA